MAAPSTWSRDGDTLRCRIAVHPSQRPRLLDYACHRLRLLRARSAGFLHAEEIGLEDQVLTLRFRSATELSAADGRQATPPQSPSAWRSWRHHVLIPALEVLLECHHSAVVGFGPFWPVAGRWVPPVSWFVPVAPGTALDGERTRDLRHAAAWMQDQRARWAGAASPEDERAIREIVQVLLDGDGAVVARRIEAEGRIGAHVVAPPPRVPTFLTLLTEAELLERLARLFRYRLLNQEEAKAVGADLQWQAVLAIDPAWRDPHFPKLERPTLQELWDELLEESRTTPVLALSEPLPNPLDAQVELDKLVRWVGVHPDQPLMFIRRANKEPPRSGYLWLHQAGDNTLMDRKRQFTDFAGRHPALSPALANTEPRHPFADNPQPREFLEDAILSTRGLFAVQGPPGTGKTYLATQVVRRFLAQVPGGRVLVCAKEHFALDHILRSITGGLRKDGTPFRAFRSVSLAKLRRGRSEIDESFLGTTVVEELSSCTFSAAATGWAEMQAATRDQHDLRLRTLGEGAANLYFCTTMDAALIGFIERTSFDLVIVEEAGKCYPSELLHAICLGRTVLMIGDQRQLPPFQERQTQTALAAWHKVLQQAQGNREHQRQLENRFGKTFQQLAALFDERGPLTDREQSWLRPFEYLFEHLPTRHRLDEQFRMEEPLSRLIGTVFYERPFQHRKYELVTSGSIPENPLDGVLPDELDIPLVWINTPHVSKDVAAGENSQGVRENHHERDVLLRYLRRLRPARKIDMVILTPYNAQKRLLLETSELQRLCATLTDTPFEQVIRTTDEYQGREAELTLLSLVRNNSLGVRAWGFMTEPERLNVMFSRTRFRQVVVGCAAHIERHSQEAAWLHAVWLQYQQMAASEPRCARILQPGELSVHG